MNRTLEVEIRNDNGVDIIQPANKLAEIFAKMLEVQTFSGKDIDYIKGLNYAVLVIQPNPVTL